MMVLMRSIHCVALFAAIACGGAATDGNGAGGRMSDHAAHSRRQVHAALHDHVDLPERDGSLFMGRRLASVMSHDGALPIGRHVVSDGAACCL